jgi:hypothetical protein
VAAAQSYWRTHSPVIAAKNVGVAKTGVAA